MHAVEVKWVKHILEFRKPNVCLALIINTLKGFDMFQAKSFLPRRWMAAPAPVH